MDTVYNNTLKVHIDGKDLVYTGWLETGKGFFQDGGLILPAYQIVPDIFSAKNVALLAGDGALFTTLQKIDPLVLVEWLTIHFPNENLVESILVYNKKESQ